MTPTDDEKLEAFESYLSQFRARQPRALESPTRSRGRGVWIAGVAASIVAAVIVNEIRRQPTVTPRSPTLVEWPIERPRMTLLDASRLAGNPGAFDRWMLDMSRTVLPDPERADSSLRVLTRQ